MDILQKVNQAISKHERDSEARISILHEAELSGELLASGLLAAFVRNRSDGSDSDPELAALRAIARSGHFLPIAEAMMSSWLASEERLQMPPGIVGLAPVMPGDVLTLDASRRISGLARGVPLVASLSYVAVIAVGKSGLSLCIVDASRLEVKSRTTRLGSTVTDVIFPGTQTLGSARLTSRSLANRAKMTGCVIRCHQIVGALEALLQLLNDHAGGAPDSSERINASFALKVDRFSRQVDNARTSTNMATKEIPVTEYFHENALSSVAVARIHCAKASWGASDLAKGFSLNSQVKRSLQQRLLSQLSIWQDEFGNDEHWTIELARFLGALSY